MEGVLPGIVTWIFGRRSFAETEVVVGAGAEGRSVGLIWKSTSIESVVLVLTSDSGLISAGASGALSLCTAAGFGLS